MSWEPAVSKIKVLFASSAIAALVFWGAAAAVPWVNALQGPGKPNVCVALAVTASISALLCWLEMRREKRDHDKTLLIKTLAGGAVPPAPEPRDAPAQARALRAVSSR